MKTLKLLLVSITVFFVQSCSNDDTPLVTEEPDTEATPPEEPENPVNNAPNSFNLLTKENLSTAVELTPTLTWSAAIDTDGDTVTYKLLLDTNQTPATLIGENISETEFILTNNLDRNTTYFWMVVAADANGAETASSSTFSFTTRGISFASVALKETAEFSKRRNHSMTEFNGKLWVIGGQDDSQSYGDVWSSVDGKDWVMEVENPFGFFGKSDHTAVVFQNKLWVIAGGFSDVWSSDNGIDWTRNMTTAEFGPREGHATVVYDNKIWVIGGTESSEQKNDVWFSEDGFDWELAAESTQFAPRTGHTTVVFDDQMVLMGGTSVTNFSANFNNEIYTSTDGINWEQITTSNIFSVRADHTSEVFDNKIWVIGGWQAVVNQMTTEQETTTFADAWYSENGSDWIKLTDNAAYGARLGHASTVFQNRILVSGGLDINPSANSRTHSNDIWVIE